MDRFLTRLVLKNGDGFLVHSESDRRDLLQIKADAKYIKNPIPTYDVFKLRGLTIKEARIELDENTDIKLLLFFGFVREYKGLKHLLRALPLVVEKVANVKLLVVGSFGDDKAEYLELIEACKMQEHVKIVDSYVPDNEIEKYFAACDAVVIPYESATQSGIVQLAYEFEKPVIVTEVGGLPDVVREGQTGHIVSPKDPKKLAEAIIRFYSEDNKTDYAAEIRKNSDDFSWGTLAERMLEKFG